MQTVTRLQDFQLEYQHLSVNSTVIQTHIQQLSKHLNPFAPSHLIQALDQLYYLMIDHASAQEQRMTETEHRQAEQHLNLHSQLIETLASAQHGQLFKQCEMAAELVTQIEEWWQQHEVEENRLAHHEEALRFRR